MPLSSKTASGLTALSLTQLLVSGLVLLAFGSPARAATLNVPVNYATIQAAVNAAQSGDTVLLADGTYTGSGNHDIDFGGKNLTVTSQNGPASTILDCGGSYTSDTSGNHRGFYLHSGETNAVISGLTIENGREGSGGGYNAGGYGGAIYGFAVSVTVQNCLLKNNAVRRANGGGGDGGAIYTGGGIYSNAGYMNVIGCTLSSNTAVDSGGGIFDREGNGALLVTNCTFVGNAAGNGGGLCSANADSGSDVVTLTNSTFTGNTASFGGGLCKSTLGSGTFTMVNCTLTGNQANYAGGIYYHSDNVFQNGGFILTNDILYGDTVGEVTTNVVGTVSDCDIQGGYAGPGNFNANPLFVNAAAGDFHLLPGFPCIGVGVHIAGLTTDKDGVFRPTPPDIGAFQTPIALPIGEGQTIFLLGTPTTPLQPVPRPGH